MNVNGEMYNGHDTCKQFTVSIEGNIGSGKSTMLEYFEKMANVQTLQEPVDKWRNLKGQNLIMLSYNDLSRWSYTFQSYIQLTMLDLHTCRQTQPVKLLERSFYSGRCVFVEQLYKSGNMPEAAYIVHNEWSDWLIKNQTIPLDLIVYLRTTPETAQKRILERGRPEGSCQLAMIEEQHQLHEDWLIKESMLPLPAPVLVLDANCSIPEMVKLYEQHKSTILCGCA